MKASKPQKSGRQSGDTAAWLCAALQVIGPILLLLILAIVLAYGLIHLAFLR